MTKIITVRMKKEIADALTMMAEKSHRSKSGLIRWLIIQEMKNLDVPTTETPLLALKENNKYKAAPSE